MKRISSLQQNDATQAQVEMVEKACLAFKELGKKPSKVNRTNLRMRIDGYYIEYSCATGKWQITQKIGLREWYLSESIHDFLEAAKELVRQFKNRDLRNKNLKENEFFFLGEYKGLRVSQIKAIDEGYYQWMLLSGIAAHDQELIEGGAA